MRFFQSKKLFWSGFPKPTQRADAFLSKRVDSGSFGSAVVAVEDAAAPSLPSCLAPVVAAIALGSGARCARKVEMGSEPGFGLASGTAMSLIAIMCVYICVCIWRYERTRRRRRKMGMASPRTKKSPVTFRDARSAALRRSPADILVHVHHVAD